MDCLVVNGGKPLSGSITVGGMKNAALPILFATILVEGRCVIENLPPISDVTTALEILRAMGCKDTYAQQDDDGNRHLGHPLRQRAV